MRALISAVGLALSLSVPPAATAAPAPDWEGSAQVRPYEYSWLTDMRPDYDYEIFVIRGLSAKQVRTTLGTVERRIRDLTPRRAERWVLAHADDKTYASPALAQVTRRGPAVVAYLPYWIQSRRTVARLSRGGVAAHFTTTIELDTYVTIAEDGRVVRSFDAGFEPPRHGALPEEEGLDWGMPDQNVWATAWAFLERVTLIHIAEDWFKSPHPTYRFEGYGP